MDRANRFLEETYIGRFNDEFAVPARNREKAWRRLIPGTDLRRLISFYYQAVVGNDNTVRLGGQTIDIPPGPKRRSYAKACVEVRQLLDGSWRVYHGDTIVAEQPSTSLVEPIRTLRRKRVRGDSMAWIYPGPDQAASYADI